MVLGNGIPNPTVTLKLLKYERPANVFKDMIVNMVEVPQADRLPGFARYQRVKERQHGEHLASAQQFLQQSQKAGRWLENRQQ